jgi:hypothetical protein
VAGHNIGHSMQNVHMYTCLISKGLRERNTYTVVHYCMDILEIGLSVVDWIGLAQDRYRWRALVNSVMKLRVP